MTDGARIHRAISIIAMTLLRYKYNYNLALSLSSKVTAADARTTASRSLHFAAENKELVWGTLISTLEDALKMTWLPSFHISVTRVSPG